MQEQVKPYNNADVNAVAIGDANTKDVETVNDGAVRDIDRVNQGTRELVDGTLDITVRAKLAMLVQRLGCKDWIAPSEVKGAACSVNANSVTLQDPVSGL